MNDAPLARYDAMCRAIEAAYKVDEVKDIRDKARALEVYAAQAMNVEAERRACEIRLRAERRAGQLLRETEKAKGTIKQGDTLPQSHDVTTGAQTLADQGISKKQSSDWQKLAAIPDDKFEVALKTDDKPSTNGIIARHAPTPGAVARRAVEAVDPAAMWLWGRLRDFEREGLLALLDPADILTTMTAEMRAETIKLAPIVNNFLGKIR
jgi:hypothetical protein